MVQRVTTLAVVTPTLTPRQEAQMKTFRDKVAAITGAGSGIGRALALELADAGCHLAISDVVAERLDETAALLAGKGVRVTTQLLDVADREAVHAWADRVVADHGKVNLIFNNAGVALSSTVEGIDYADYEWIMNINFWGVVYGTRAFLPHLRASGDGHVVNISSIFGVISVPTMHAYNASKFAVRGFTESLRIELDMLDQGVSATCVHPGGIRTNIARDARMSSSVVGVVASSEDAGRRQFEKLFITSPEQAARTILKGVRRDARRVLVGPDAVALDLGQRLLPTGYQKLSQAMSRRLNR